MHDLVSLSSYSNQDTTIGPLLIVGMSNRRFVYGDKRGRVLYDGALDSEGFPHGEGQCIYNSDEVYSGDWIHGKRHGQGCYEGDMHRYTGKWADGLPSGVGIEVSASGYTYRGSWILGYKSGFGSYHSLSRARYDGSWAFNKRNGQGVETHPDGVRVIGYFADDRAIGECVVLACASLDCTLQYFDNETAPSLSPI